MAAYNFRSALGGFNRQDVVNYIEYSNAKHNTLVNQLRAELAAANDQLRPLPQLQEQCAQQEAIIADQVASQLAALQSAIVDSKQALNDAAATLYTIRPTEE